MSLDNHSVNFRFQLFHRISKASIERHPPQAAAAPVPCRPISDGKEVHEVNQLVIHLHLTAAPMGRDRWQPGSQLLAVTNMISMIWLSIGDNNQPMSR